MLRVHATTTPRHALPRLIANARMSTSSTTVTSTAPSTTAVLPVTVDSLRDRIQSTLAPTHVSVEDTSGGCGQSFNVVIVSRAFEGKSLLQRHRLVNDHLKAEIEQMHAFSQKSYTPEQWATMQQ